MPFQQEAIQKYLKVESPVGTEHVRHQMSNANDLRQPFVDPKINPTPPLRILRREIPNYQQRDERQSKPDEPSSPTQMEQHMERP